MGETIHNRDAGSAGLTVQHQPDTHATDCHALAVSLAATSGRASALQVRSENAEASAALVQGPGDLLDLRDSTGASRFRVGQGGDVAGIGSLDLGDQPSEQGLLAWTYNPNMAGHVTAQSNAGVAGRVTLTRIPIRRTITWSSVWVGISGVDAAATLTNSFLGVYDVNGNLKGTTADLASAWTNAANAKAIPNALVTPFTATPGFYYIALLLNGTWTTNTFTLKCSGAGSSTNANLVAPNLRYSSLLTAQTSLPSSITLANQVTTIITTGWASQWYGVA